MKKGIPGLWRKALFLLSGNSATALLTLARNLLVARMLPVADYGIAATFAITMAVVEMASALGLQQQIIQAKDGDDPRFQAALQGFQVLRGAFSALVLLAIAHPLATFLGIPEVAWAYQVLAVMPLLNALQHFDIHRMQRRMAFGPVLATSLLPAALSLALIWPLVVWFGDWQAMLWAIIAQGLASMLMSHLMAERPYRLTLDRTIMARNLAFGWPLLLNTILLFLVFNGEKLIVGRELGMEALGIFAMGVTLTLTPTLVMTKSAMGVFLPKLSSISRKDAEGETRFASLSALTMQCTLALGLSTIVGTAILGDVIVRALLGEKYLALLPLMTPLAVLASFRAIKAGSAIISLARGQSENSLVGNIARVFTFPISWFVAEEMGSLIAIVAIAMLGELVGYLMALGMTRRRTAVSVRPILWPLAVSMVVIALSIAVSTTFVQGEIGLAGRIALSMGLLLTLLASILTMKELRHYASSGNVQLRK